MRAPLLMMLKWIENLPRLPRGIRLFLVITMHVALFSMAYLGAWLVRFDFSVPDFWLGVMWKVLPLAVGIKLAVFAGMKMFQGWWKYVSLRDVTQLARGIALGSGIFVLVNALLVAGVNFPRSIYLLDFGLGLFLIGGARGSLRLVREAARSMALGATDKANLLIIGAGDTAETLLREIQKNPNLPYNPIGFLDDDAYKHGLRIHGVPVLGGVATLNEAVVQQGIGQIIIAMPSASREEMRRVIELTKQTGVNTQILPAVESILDGRISLNQLREVSISDVLGREPVRLDSASIAAHDADTRWLSRSSQRRAAVPSSPRPAPSWPCRASPRGTAASSSSRTRRSRSCAATSVTSSTRAASRRCTRPPMGSRRARSAS